MKKIAFLLIILVLFTPLLVLAAVCDDNGGCGPDIGLIIEQHKTTNRLYLFLAVVLVVLVAFILAYIEFMRLKARREEGLELKNHVLNFITKGLSEEQVKADLRKIGYPDKTINNIFEGLKEYDLKGVYHSSVRDRELQLKRYVFDMLNKGYSEDKVRKDLRMSGWPDATINNILKELSIYFPKKKSGKKEGSKEYVPLSEIKKPRKTARKPAQKPARKAAKRARK